MAKEKIRILKRVMRQGCILLPPVFNVCSDVIFKAEITEDDGIKMNLERVSNIRYAVGTISIYYRSTSRFTY